MKILAKLILAYDMVQDRWKLIRKTQADESIFNNTKIVWVTTGICSW